MCDDVLKAWFEPLGRFIKKLAVSVNFNSVQTLLILGYNLNPRDSHVCIVNMRVSFSAIISSGQYCFVVKKKLFNYAQKAMQDDQ